jgi:hypothetical protein
MASRIQSSSASGSLPRSRPRKRIASDRMQANTGSACLRTSTISARRGVSKPRGLIHSAAAMIGEITPPVRGSSGRMLAGEGDVGFFPAFCRHDATKAASRE